MNPNLKKRIESINKGIIPEGYKKTKAGIVPVEWETVKLKTISKHSTEKNKDLKYHETYTNSATQGIIKQTDYFDKQISNNENIDGYYVVKHNDYVYNPRISVSAPCGPIRKSHFSETGVMSPLYTVFRLNDEYEDNEYIEHYFNSPFWHRYMSSVANYGARHDRMNITNDDLFNMPIPFPPLPEQQKIAEILGAQDKLIELQARKIEQLQALKKACLQRMFPKKGCDRPEIRFPEFTDAWEQRRLGDMCDEFQSGKSINASDITDSGEYAVYGGNGFRGYTDTYNHDGDYALIGRQGALCGNMNFSTGKAYFTEHAVAVHGNNDNDTMFLYYLLDLMNLGQYSGQSAQPGLAVNKIIQLYTKAPKMAEQKQISRFFQHLDHLITLHQRKLDEEKQKKKALMQLLLTGIVRVKV